MIFISKPLKPVICIFIITIVFLLLLNNSPSVLTFKSSLKKITIILDAGHGYPDSGASSVNNIYEKDINLKITKKLKKLLEKQGATVILTRISDDSLSKSKKNNKRDDLNKRVQIRDSSDADIFISIHMNHFEDSRYTGAQVFYNSSDNRNEHLAKCIQKNIIDHADPKNKRKIKQDNNIYVLKNSQIPSVLIECGFLSNLGEANKLNTDKYQNKISEAICKGIVEYTKIN